MKLHIALLALAMAPQAPAVPAKAGELPFGFEDCLAQFETFSFEARTCLVENRKKIDLAVCSTRAAAARAYRVIAWDSAHYAQQRKLPALLDDAASYMELADLFEGLNEKSNCGSH